MGEKLLKLLLKLSKVFLLAAKKSEIRDFSFLSGSFFVSGKRQLLALSPLTLGNRRLLRALVNKTREQIEVYKITLSSNQKSSRGGVNKARGSSVSP